MFRIDIEGEEVHAVENSQPEEFQDVKVYASDPWHPAQPGSIRNLVVESTCSGGACPPAKDWRTIYTKAEEHQLVQGTLLTTLPTLGKEWKVTHDFKATKYLNTWCNSLHLTIGGEYGQ